jgi:hypothetical protein
MSKILRCIATLLCSTISLCRWIPSERCQNFYSEVALDIATPGGLVRCEPNGTVRVGPNGERLCERIIHSCSKEERAVYHLAPPRPMEWSEVNPEYTIYLWKSIYHKLANKTFIFLGDSLMRQVLSSVILYLNSLGFECTPLRCANGLEFIRPDSNHLTNGVVDNIILPLLLSPNAGVMLLHVGIHYGGGRCPGYAACDDADYAFSRFNRTTTTAKIAWLTGFRAHFWSESGLYQDFIKLHHKDKNGPVCAPLPPGSLFTGPLREPGEHIRKTFPWVPVIEIEDLIYDRWDMHLGPLTYHVFDGVNGMDCLHLCMQPCFWESVMWRIGTHLADLLGIE